MKTPYGKYILVFLTVSSFAALLMAGALDDLGSKAYHLKMAAQYDRKAKEMEFVILEHQQMKADYQKMPVRVEGLPAGPSREQEKIITHRSGDLIPPSVLQDMASHCDAIIKNAEKLKKDYEEVAQWHRQRAKDLSEGGKGEKHEQK